MVLRNTSEDDSAWERLANRTLAGNRLRADMEFSRDVEDLKPAPGGSTPRPTKKMSWRDKRAADRILRDGRGKSTEKDGRGKSNADKTLRDGRGK